MILVKVVKLIVDIDWTLDSGINCLKINGASQSIWILNFIKALIDIIVPFFKLHNFITHNLENYTDSQENYTENTEGQHSAHSCWHWPPSWQRLLFEF